MPYRKLNGILSICRKAGKMAAGFAPMKEALDTGKVSSVLTTSDISPKTGKEVCYFCQKHGIPVQSLPMDMQQMGAAIGRKAAVIAVLDEGFSDRIRQLCAEIAQQPS